MEFNYNGITFSADPIKGRAGKVKRFRVRKINSIADWPGFNGRLPPCSFLDKILGGSAFEGEFVKENQDGSREYSIRQV